MFGPYLLLSRIGSGTTGVVWRAKRLADDHPVAVKVLYPHLLEDSDTLIRLLRAGMLRINHPNVVRVLDFYVASGNEEAAIVTELVEGSDLHQLLRSGEVSRSERLRLLSEAATGLAAAHDANIVHRDIKPHNVLVREDNGDRHALLSDFGLVKLPDGPTISQIGRIIGTPAYLAPELLVGNMAIPASDVYSLGVTVYEVLTERRPFNGTVDQVLRAHQTEQPRQPAEIPDQLWAFLETCLAKDPRRRPSAKDAAAVLRDLANEAALAEPVRSSPTDEAIEADSNIDTPRPLRVSDGKANTPATREHAGFSADVATGPDHLGITSEVNTLCDVIMAREVQPPLSVGLFGDWGTGKSFFMGQMQDRISRLAAASQQARLEGNESALCANVCQIGFNAWHYLDTDLWASLAATIFDRLAAADPTMVSREVLQDLPSVRRLRTDLETRRERTVQLLDSANQELDEQSSVGLSDVLTNDRLTTAATTFTRTTAGHVDDALLAAGVPEDQIKTLDLRAMTNTASGLGRNLIFVFQRTKWTVRLAIVSALLLFIGGPVLLTVLLREHLGLLTASVSSLAGCGVAALLIARPHLDRASRALEAARNLVDSVNERRRAPIEARRDSLRQRMVDIDLELLRLDTKIQELRRANSVSAFAVKRHQDDRYRQHEGLVATLRRDLEEMSRRLTASTDRHADLERIVLYIDDLDRCPSDRVVEVLQAIHLLLAFPLFVVVVGVDSRWLLHAVDQHLRTTDPDVNDRQWTTAAQNYLEKIFQLSLCLRPMSAAGYAALVEANAGASSEIPLQSSVAAASMPAHAEEVDQLTRTVAAPLEPLATPEPQRVVTGRRLRQYAGSSKILYLNFDPTYPLLTAVTSAGDSVRYDLRGDGPPLVSTRLVDSQVSAAYPVSEGRLLLLGPTVVLVDLAGGQTLHEITEPLPISAVTSPDSDDLVLTWRLADGSERHALTHASIPSIDTVAPTALRQTLAISRQWRVERDGTNTIVTHRSGTVVTLEVVADQAWLEATAARLAIVEPNRSVRLWHLNPSPPCTPQEIPVATSATTLALGPSNLMATADRDHVTVWDTATGYPRAKAATSGTVTALAFTTDGGRLAIGTTQGSIEVWTIQESRTNLDLTASALQINAAEQSMIIAVQPLMDTPRSTKRLINTYRLLRASLTRTELDRLHAGEHKVVVLLLAIILGKPDEAQPLLRDLTSNAALPTTFTALVRRAIRRPPNMTHRRAAGRRYTATEHPLESAVAAIVAETGTPDDSTIYRRWARTVSRYSFRLQPGRTPN